MQRAIGGSDASADAMHGRAAKRQRNMDLNKVFLCWPHADSLLVPRCLQV